MKNVGRLVLLALALALAGCATGSQMSSNRNEITQEEIAGAGARNAYELVERLRPLWLQSRGDRSFRLETTILVYQDNARLGGLDMLRSIPIELVRGARALDSAEAMRLPGAGAQHVERAIVIVTQTGSRQ